MDIKNQYVAIETAQCSTCNLDCVYCYIPKNKALKAINRQWDKVYRNNQFYELLSEKFSITQLESIGFWGGEPTMGFKSLEDIETLLKRHPSVKQMSTSSNFTTIAGTTYMLSQLNKVLDKMDRGLRFDLQISIDGTEAETDKNRGKGVYKKVRDNIRKIVEASKEWDRIRLLLSPKSTNVVEDFRAFSEDPQNLIDYISAFEDLDSEFESLIGGRDNIAGVFRTLPTLALPGDYTKSDGEYFYKYHKTLDEVVSEKFPEWVSERDQYYHRLMNMLKNAVQIYRLEGNRYFSCSAGKSMMSVDPDGSIHGCHGSFWYNYEEYLNSAGGQVDWCEGERIIDFDKDRFWEGNKSLMAGYRDEYNQARLNYITQSFVYHLNNYMNITLGTVKALALAGQINPIFKNDDWAKTYAAFIALMSSCWYNNYMVTGSFSVTPASIYRIYGNGTFEYTARKIAKDKLDA